MFPDGSGRMKMCSTEGRRSAWRHSWTCPRGLRGIQDALHSVSLDHGPTQAITNQNSPTLKRLVLAKRLNASAIWNWQSFQLKKTFRAVALVCFVIFNLATRGSDDLRYTASPSSWAFRDFRDGDGIEKSAGSCPNEENAIDYFEISQRLH
ncbi:unnamed protein product, partial [Nesidiocoris tenuis]